MKKYLYELIKVKSLLSLLFSITTCILAIMNLIEMETFMAITMSIITYYFTRRCKDNGDARSEDMTDE